MRISRRDVHFVIQDGMPLRVQNLQSLRLSRLRQGYSRFVELSRNPEGVKARLFNAPSLKEALSSARSRYVGRPVGQIPQGIVFQMVVVDR